MLDYKYRLKYTTYTERVEGVTTIRNRIEIIAR
ncbi:MAG: hypothetical protein [Caudoviricetes sp.]|nr:MAG: hypothetical protein [Caudoviricetes sp.]